MITAIIIAGGVGKRMGQDIPKQFITIEGKPIIIYTLESFQHHPQVDRGICDWINKVDFAGSNPTAK